MRAFVLTLLLAAAAVAAEPRKLPASSLKGTSGEPIASDRIARAGKWVLVYVRPECATCETMLLQFRNHPGEASVAERVVIVVGHADAAQLQDMRAAHEWLASASWLADESGEFRKSLDLNVVPTAFGFKDDAVVWTHGGMMLDAVKTRSVLTTWVKPSPARKQ